MDERTRYFRRLRRLRNSARRWSVAGGGLAAAAVVLTPYAGVGLPDAFWAAGVGASLAFTWWRYRDFREQAALPPPPADPASVARLDELRASMNQKRGDTTAAG